MYSPVYYRCVSLSETVSCLAAATRTSRCSQSHSLIHTYNTGVRYESENRFGGKLELNWANYRKLQIYVIKCPDFFFMELLIYIVSRLHCH